MAATSVLTKAKKILGTQPDEEPIIYHIDEFALREWERTITPAIDAGNNLLSVLKQDSHPAQTIEELYAAKDNPTDYHTTKHRIAKEDELAKYEALGIEVKIKMPEGFNRVLEAAKLARREFDNLPAHYFIVKDGELELTDAYYERRNRHCYCVAKTAEEKELVKFCQGVIEAIEKLEPILNKRYKAKIAEPVKWKRYATPLPYFLKIVRTPEGPKIIPSPSFIKECFGGSGHLGVSFPNTNDIRRAQADRMKALNLGERYVKFTKKMPGGTFRDFLVPEKDYETKHKNINTTLHPGVFNRFGQKYGTPIELRETASKVPPVGAFEN